MRKFDESGLQICKFQARLFESSASGTKGSSPVFINCFMHSDFADMMDSEAFAFGSFDSEKILAEMNGIYKLDRGRLKYPAEELYWMGYVYRYWCYVHEVSSRTVYGIIRPEEMRALYLPYHSLDPESAIQRICGAKNRKPENSMLESLKKAHNYH